MRYLPAFLLLSPVLCLAQSSDVAAPSKPEISELLAKAEEKVTSFEEAVKAVRPDLENQQTDLLSKDVNAATSAHRTIAGLQHNGPSAYRLVTLISNLDDITLNASKTGTVVILVRNGKIDAETQAKLTLLWTAQNTCSDISELLLHATLRLIQSQEDRLAHLTAETH